VIEQLRVAGKHERVTLGRRGELDEIREIRIHEIRAGQDHAIGVRRNARDRADAVDVSVAELEGVVVADRYDACPRLSVLPPLALGLFVGVLSAIMGVGGGFILVPAMIYLLRMPAPVYPE